MCVSEEGGREGGGGGRGADTELKTKTPHVNVGNKGSREHPQGSKKQGGKGLKKQGQRSEKPGVRKTGVQGLKNMQGLKNRVRGQKDIGPI